MTLRQSMQIRLRCLLPSLPQSLSERSSRSLGLEIGFKNNFPMVVKDQLRFILRNLDPYKSMGPNGMCPVQKGKLI